MKKKTVDTGIKKILILIGRVFILICMLDLCFVHKLPKAVVLLCIPIIIILRIVDEKSADHN